MSGWLEIAALLAAFAAAGGFLGLVCGAMGVGGGAFAVMIVLQFLAVAGVEGSGALQVALGTASATLALMSARAAVAQRIDWAGLRGWAPWAALGAAVGGYAAAQAPEAWLRGGVGLAVLAAGLRLIFDDGRALRAPRFAAQAALATALGAVSGGAGLGGGAFAAPLLRRLGAEARAAAALAAGLGMVICAVAALMLLSATPQAAPPFTLGAVNLPGAVTAALAAGAAAPLGAQVAQAAPPRAVGAVAAFLLCVTGLSLLRGGLGG